MSAAILRVSFSMLFHPVSGIISRGLKSVPIIERQIVGFGRRFINMDSGSSRNPYLGEMGSASMDTPDFKNRSHAANSVVNENDQNAFRESDGGASKKTIFVGNIPWQARPADLQELFSKYTSVVSTRVIFDRYTGRSRGFGYVEVDCDNFENLLEELQGIVYQGRPLRVNEATVDENKIRDNQNGEYRNDSRMQNRPPMDRFHNVNEKSMPELSEEQRMKYDKSFF